MAPETALNLHTVHTRSIFPVGPQNILKTDRDLPKHVEKFGGEETEARNYKDTCMDRGNRLLEV